MKTIKCMNARFIGGIKPEKIDVWSFYFVHFAPHLSIQLRDVQDSGMLYDINVVIVGPENTSHHYVIKSLSAHVIIILMGLVH